MRAPLNVVNLVMDCGLFNTCFVLLEADGVFGYSDILGDFHLHVAVHSSHTVQQLLCFLGGKNVY